MTKPKKKCPVAGGPCGYCKDMKMAKDAWHLARRRCVGLYVGPMHHGGHYWHRVYEVEELRIAADGKSEWRTRLDRSRANHTTDYNEIPELVHYADVAAAAYALQQTLDRTIENVESGVWPRKKR